MRLGLQSTAGFRPIGIIVAILFAAQFFIRDFSDPYQRPIAGDAQAYYAYLPAIFIYGDLDYEFIPRINKTYYPPTYEKSFLLDVNGERVNKTFPGAAVLYAPFFFIAHGIALIGGWSPDGYSEIYQIFFLIGQWFWLLAGMNLLHRAMAEFGFSKGASLLASAMVLLGTNLFFYVFYDVSVTHGMNFFLVNAFVFLLLKFKTTFRFSFLAWSIFVLALIGIVRPTNALVLLLVPVFFPEKEFYLQCWQAMRKPLNLAVLAAIVIAVFSIPLILWKYQADRWIVYAYGDEGFIFSDPHFREFLFSYLKGWFTWTPLALVVIAFGLFVLFRRNAKQGIFVAIFYVLSIYVFSSWWCWYYGAGMSQRVMIDHYILLAFLFCITWQWVGKHPNVKAIFMTFVMTLSGLNLAQAWQIRYGVIPLGSATEEQYWDNFLRFKKQAKIYPRENWILIEEIPIDLDTSGNHNISAHIRREDKTWVTNVRSADQYSGVIRGAFTHHVSNTSKIILSFEARSHQEETTESRLVYHYDTLTSTTKSYQFGRFLKKDEWVRVEVLSEPVSGNFRAINLYFWNSGSDEEIDFRNIRIKHYFSDDYL